MTKGYRENDTTQKAHIRKAKGKNVYECMISYRDNKAYNRFKSKPYDVGEWQQSQKKAAGI